MSTLVGSAPPLRPGCKYTLEARVSGGRPDDPVELINLVLGWREVNGQTITGLGDHEVSASVLSSDWFGTTRIVSGQTRTATRYVWIQPHRQFRHTHSLRYRLPSGVEKTANYELSCG